MNVKLIGLGDLDEATGTRECFFEVNGFPRSVKRLDETASSNVVVRPKADSSHIGAVGAPMPGVVVETKVKVGDPVELGTPMLVLSAMKMETVVPSPLAGTVKRVPTSIGDNVRRATTLASAQPCGSSCIGC